MSKTKKKNLDGHRFFVIGENGRTPKFFDKFRID